jgi:ActR/RegA family two-component response regulator
MFSRRRMMTLLIGAPARPVAPDLFKPKDDTIAEVTFAHIRRILREENGNVAAAGRRLGMTARNVGVKVKNGVVS